MVTAKSREVVKGKVEMVPGFSLAKTEPIHRLVISMEALWKQGKTHFALTAPAPICYIDMDTGTEGVIEKFSKDKEIQVCQFDYHDSTELAEWVRMWEECKKAFIDACNSKRIRTVIWDTATEAYELIRMARFGKLNKVVMSEGKALPLPYGVINTEFRDMLRQALKTDKNFIFIHKMKDEYIKNERTGGVKRSGFGDMEFVVQMNIRTWFNAEGKIFGLTVMDARHGMKEFAGLQLEEPLNTFPVLASQIFPNTSIEDWE